MLEPQPYRRYVHPLTGKKIYASTVLFAGQRKVRLLSRFHKTATNAKEYAVVVSARYNRRYCDDRSS